MKKELRAWDFAIKYFEFEALRQNFSPEEAHLYGAKMALILNLKKNGYYRNKPTYKNHIKKPIKRNPDNKMDLIKIYDEYLARGWDKILETAIKTFFETQAHKVKKSQLYNACKFFVANYIANKFGIDKLHVNYRKWYERKIASEVK